MGRRKREEFGHSMNTRTLGVTISSSLVMSHWNAVRPFCCLFKATLSCQIRLMLAVRPFVVGALGVTFWACAQDHLALWDVRRSFRKSLLTSTSDEVTSSSAMAHADLVQHSSLYAGIVDLFARNEFVAPAPEVDTLRICVKIDFALKLGPVDLRDSRACRIGCYSNDQDQSHNERERKLHGG